MEAAKGTRLADAINQLTKRQREAIFLRYYHGLGNAEIAETMGISIQSFYNLTHEAIRALKKQLTCFGSWLLVCFVQ
jgi:RNA polymerase sigma factor (sigma-70 family)